MRNIVLRTITFFVAVPALAAIVLLLPHQNHLVLCLIAIAASALGARELAELFERGDVRYRASWAVIPALGGTIPAVQTLAINGIVPQEAVLTVVYAVASVVLLLQVFRRRDEGFGHTLSNTAASLTLLLYPGLFLSYVVRMASRPHAGVLILTFLCMVFFNDTMAYLTGMLYRNIQERRARRHGRSWMPRLTFPVSPKKTLIGFAGGLAIAPATLITAHLLFPHAIPGSVVRLALAGIAVGLATIFGDLIESAIKRSATSKDSGTLIPGRGGMLDSIDSILYAAPVYYYLVSTL